MRLPRYYHFLPAGVSIPRQHTFSSLNGKCFRETIDPYVVLPPAEETDLANVLKVGGSLEDRCTNFLQSSIDVTSMFNVVKEESTIN